MDQETEKEIQNYQDLIVWQKAIELVVAVYELTSSFPKTETYGLINQMRRSAVSIPSNIAEGTRRSSRKDFRHFLLNAFGSGAELETQIVIAKRLKFALDQEFQAADDLLNEIMRMLNRITAKLKSKN